MIDTSSNNKIKENKYKILRMSLLLGNGDDREETINNFEDAARDIDAMNDEVYIKELDSKFYDTLTLEEEEKKLTSLVDYIGGRVAQRNSLINDFTNVTGFGLNNLPPIKYYDRLDEYKSRLGYIKEYLDNVSKIDGLNKDIDRLNVDLEKAYNNKERAEDRNKNDERILLEKFKNIINRDSELKDVDVDNIDNVLADINVRVNDSKKSLDIFEKSFSTLKNAGISHEDEQEYSSYVEGARDSYYREKEQQYLLTIYSLIKESETKYDRLINKRDHINNILYERLSLRKNLGIMDNDSLVDIYDLLDKQYDNIKNQKYDIDNIDALSSEINSKRDIVRDLELDNQKVEILSLLKEFGIIDTYDDADNSIENNVDEEIFDNDKEEVKDIELPVIEDEVASFEAENGNDSIEEVSDDIFGSDNSLDDNVSDVVKDDNSDEVSLEDNNIPDISIDNNINDFFAPEENVEDNNEEKVKEGAKDNEVVSIKDVSAGNVSEIVDKANNVMKRVGKMLGIDIKGEEEVVSVQNEVIQEVKDIPEAVVDEKKEEEVIPVDANNLFFNNELESNTNDNNDFWNSSFDDGGLSSLPDLPVSDGDNSNNFFNSEIPELNMDFGSNDSEVQ